MDPQKFLKLRKQIDRLKSDVDRSQGSLDQLMSRLKKEFGCKSIESAKSLLLRLERMLQEEESKFNKALKNFQSKWGDKLDGFP